MFHNPYCLLVFPSSYINGGGKNIQTVNTFTYDSLPIFSTPERNNNDPFFLALQSNINEQNNSWESGIVLESSSTDKIPSITMELAHCIF
jgi:hypothetical protein